MIFSCSGIWIMALSDQSSSMCPHIETALSANGGFVAATCTPCFVVVVGMSRGFSYANNMFTIWNFSMGVATYAGEFGVVLWYELSERRMGNTAAQTVSLSTLVLEHRAPERRGCVIVNHVVPPSRSSVGNVWVLGRCSIAPGTEGWLYEVVLRGGNRPNGRRRSDHHPPQNAEHEVPGSADPA